VSSCMVGNFSMVFLRGCANQRIESMIDYLAGRMSGRLPVLTFSARGESVIARLMAHIYMGDAVSLYLAGLRGVDPYPVNAIQDLKAHFK